MEKITRDVIADLWPLYRAGEASTDTHTLVQEYLQSDPEFAKALTDVDRERLPALETPKLAPDHELKTLQRVRRRLTGPMRLLQLAIIFSCLAMGALISDTSFDVSPRRFIVTAAIAVCFWAAFLIRLYKMRGQVLVIRS
jgi:hypothetical protein